MKNFLLLFIVIFISRSYAQDYEYKLFYDKKELRNIVVNSIVQSENDYLWLGTSYGLYRFDGENFKIYYKSDGLADNYVNKIYIDNDNRLWVSTLAGIQVFNDVEFKEEESNFNIAIPSEVDEVLKNRNISIEGFPLEIIITDTISYDNVLFASTQGDGLWVQKEGKWNNMNIDYYIGKGVNDLYLDKDNNFWIGSNYGLTLLSKATIKKYSSFQKRGVLQILEHANSMWFTGQFGVYRVHEMKSEKLSLGDNEYYMVCVGLNHLGQLQIGGFNSALFEWDGRQLNAIDLFKTEFSALTIVDINAYENKTYYACVDRLIQWDGEAFAEIDITEAGKCYDIQSYGDGLYIACSNGVYQINKSISNPSLSKLDFHNRKLYGRVLEVDGFGNLWIGTYSEGLVKYNSGIYEEYSKQNVLGNDLIKSLEWDVDRNCLWVGTNEGLNQLVFNKKGEIIETNRFDNSTGYPFLSFHNKSLYVSSDGSLLFAVNTNDQTAEDYVYECSELESNKAFLSPSVIIDSVIVWDTRDMLNPTTYTTRKHNLKYSENNISIAFSGIHLTQGEHISYQWYLDGYENDWRLPSTDNRAHYTNLTGGTYTLNVRTKIPGSDWSHTVKYNFIIPTPFWKKLWFLLSMGLLVLYGIYMLVNHWQKQRYDKDLELFNQQKIKAELELKALRAQLNPHFIFNVLNSIQYSVYNKENGLGVAFIQDFASLIRKTLLHSRKTLIPIRDEIEFVNLYVKVENVRFETPFQYNLKPISDTDFYGINVPPLIFQPYVENAIKHGLFNKHDHSDNRLNISFEIKGSLLFCTIEDNGVGRAIADAKKNKFHESQGLQMMQERIDYLNVLYKGSGFAHDFHDIINSKGEVVGTRVVITIPIDLNTQV